MRRRFGLVCIIQAPWQGAAQPGYSLVELVVTIGLIMIVSSMAWPSLLDYYRSAGVRAGAEAVQAYLNRGRQLAIRTNTPVCVANATTTVQYRQHTCAGTVLTVAGLTASSGDVQLPASITLSSGTNVIFSSLGNAAPGATYTVTDTVSGRSLTVTVSPSGRITVR